MAHSVCTTHQCVSSTRERRGFKVFLGCPGLVVPICLFLTPFLPLSLSFPLPPSPSPQELVLSPDLETLTFSCSEKIIIDVLAATNTITMHSKEVRTVGPQVCQRLNVLCKEGRREEEEERVYAGTPSRFPLNLTSFPPRPCRSKYCPPRWATKRPLLSTTLLPPRSPSLFLTLSLVCPPSTICT